MYPGGYTAEITNLTPRATENDVQNFFEYCGVIERVDVIR
jgi:RNA recognition motif-containing protein